MKIKIHADGHKLTVPLPLSLIINGIVGNAIAEKTAGKDYPITLEQARQLVSALKAAKKNFGSFTLIDIEASSGEKVKIIL